MFGVRLLTTLLVLSLTLLPGLAFGQTEGEDVGPTPEKERRGLIPSLDLFFPEGELDVRLNRLVKNVFFEGQLRYDFPRGDISAFLRYRYYGFRRTYQISVFDVIEFEEIQQFSSDFERSRGALLLVEWPHDYHRRTFFLAELDNFSSNKEEFRFTTNRSNTFLRLGYQFGTPDDSRSNAIVGETRAQVDRLFTAHRKIGPHGWGLTGALTYGSEFLGGDFSYIKVELETLRRFDVSPRTFLVGRLHAGSFPLKETVRNDTSLPEVDRLSIPTIELFQLDGRDNLKGLKERQRGTEEIHGTLEYFFPWFLNRSRRFLGLDWQSWYWVLYSGYGTIGVGTAAYTELGAYVPDLGLGFESSFKFKSYDLFLSAVVAQALDRDDSPKVRFTIKSYH